MSMRRKSYNLAGGRNRRCALEKKREQSDNSIEVHIFGGSEKRRVRMQRKEREEVGITLTGEDSREKRESVHN